MKQWNVDQSHDNLRTHPAICEAANLLQSHEVVAFPTETVYGLGGNALSDAAMEKIFSAKGRPSDNPLIIHIASQEQLQAIVATVPDIAMKLMDSFWPGPLTIVFPKGAGISRRVTAGLDTLAVRMPDHPVALALIQAAQLPIAAPSANRSGKPSPTTAKHVMADLNGKIAGLINGGETGFGIESTVVACTANKVTILRPGGITKAQLETVAPTVWARTNVQKNRRPPASPGMKYPHYAPKATLLLASGRWQDVQTIIDTKKQAGKRVGVLTTAENAEYYKADVVLTCGKRQDLSTVARQLYGTLRRFDDYEVDIIVSESFPRVGIGAAIMNRLEKAAGTNVLK